MRILHPGDVIVASTLIDAPPATVFAIVSDPKRFPEWSPETIEVEWIGPDRFVARNRRRLGRWRTVARVTTAEPDRIFRFVVEALGRDWTEWTYRVAPGAESGSCELTQEFRMIARIPVAALLFEWLLLFVTDRPKDLHANLRSSVDQIRVIAERRQSKP